MIYEYSCGHCKIIFDVIKSASVYDREEKCRCGEVAKRKFVPSRLHLSKTAVQHPEYNPGLGCIVKNAQHRKELCKIKGVEEIGNESPEKIHKKFDKDREDKMEREWRDLDGKWIGSDGDG